MKLNYKDIKLTPLLDTIQFINMSDEEYFSSKWAGYISNSKLSLICPEQDGSPEKWLKGMQHKVSDSLTFGSAVHCLTLQPDEFELADGIDRPTAKMGAMADELYKIYKEGNNVTDEDIIKASDKIDYYKGKMNANKIANVIEKCSQYWEDRFLWEAQPTSKEPIYLDFNSRMKLASCLSNLENNKEIQSLLHPDGFNVISVNEGALFIDVKAEYEGKETILKLKAKLDNFTIDLDLNEVVLNDLKTTGHLLNQFGESFEKYRYFRQMGMYLWMLVAYVKKCHNMDTINNLSANMLLSCTIPDYRSGIYKVSEKMISRGFEEFKDLLKRVAAIEFEL